MKTVTNCRSGELVIQAPQCEIDRFVAQAESEGVEVRRHSGVTNGRKPNDPLGLPSMRFGQESVPTTTTSSGSRSRSSAEEPTREPVQPVVIVTNAGTGKRGLGLPSMVFNRTRPEQPPETPVENKAQGRPSVGLGIPSMVF